MARKKSSRKWLARKKSKNPVEQSPTSQATSQPLAPPPGVSVTEWQAQIQQYSGPLPHPDHLRAYEEIAPGSALRILTAFEKQTEHRQALETTVVKGNVRAQTRGSWQGFTIAILFGAGSFYLIVNGHPLAGGFLGSVDLTALVAVFVYGRNEQRKEREAKLARMKPKRR